MHWCPTISIFIFASKHNLPHPFAAWVRLSTGFWAWGCLGRAWLQIWTVSSSSPPLPSSAAPTPPWPWREKIAWKCHKMSHRRTHTYYTAHRQDFDFFSYLSCASFCHLAATCSRRSRPMCRSINFISSRRWIEPRRIQFSLTQIRAKIKNC